MNSSATLLSIASLLFFSAVFHEPSSVVGSPSFRGVSPEDVKYFKSNGDVIDCKDGSRKFSSAQLNDDFCDCPDGTDEPGTSACPGAKFYCRNAGHVPVLLFSSRVNDGICDCCDGSDEYDGNINCSNTCWEAGKIARDKLKAKIATYKEGVLIREQEVEQAKTALVKDEAELTKLKGDEKILKGLVQQLKERKEQIEKAEEEERKRKEEEEKLKKESEVKDEQAKKSAEGGNQSQSSEEEDRSKMEHARSESTDDDKIELSEELSPDESVDDAFESGDDNDHADSMVETESLAMNEGQHISGDEDKPVSQVDAVSGGEVQDFSDRDIEGGNDSSEPTETMSKEELGRRVASRWTGENTEKESQEKLTEDISREEQSKYNHYKEDDGYASESDNDDRKYEDDGIGDEMHDDVNEEYHPHTSSPLTYESEDESDFSESSPTWLEKIQQTVKSILQAVNLFQTPVDKSEVDRVRKEYDESSAKLSKMQSRISKLTQKLGLDFGRDKEFYSFYGRCFENKQNKYTYKVCPYKKASQEEGHSTTQLGHWDKFDDSYRIMAFSNGDSCWNGPNRKMTVRLRCGLKNEVTDVDEPSRCEYTAILSTPAVCTEYKLKELQGKLALMEKEQPSSHDEL